MSCINGSADNNEEDGINISDQGKHSTTEKAAITYSSYLSLRKLLSCQSLVDCGKYSHDQHLFQITHQVYELWFKQIIFEIDSIKVLFKADVMDERNLRVIINRLNRIVLILKTLVDQISILETMTALDFMDFRGHLQAASGFQSLQFRLLENKIGVKDENRVRYNKKNYQAVFDSDPDAKEELEKSLSEDSLQLLVEKWLERTPGCEDEEFQFWKKYTFSANLYLKEQFEERLEKIEDPNQRVILEADWVKEKKSYGSIIDEEQYNEMLSKGDKTFSHKAFKGAIMISLYRDETRFSQPHQILNLLVDIDSWLTKWRYNHVVMVQRMIGSKLGTGGSSGYQYLRSTVSDRYKPFCDLFNLSTYLLPREYIPRLSESMLERLRNVAHVEQKQT